MRVRVRVRTLRRQAGDVVIVAHQLSRTSASARARARITIKMAVSFMLTMAVAVALVLSLPLVIGRMVRHYDGVVLVEVSIFLSVHQLEKFVSGAVTAHHLNLAGNYEIIKNIIKVTQNIVMKRGQGDIGNSQTTLLA